MFSSFCLVKNNKIANNPTGTKATGKNKQRYKIFRVLKFYDVCLTNFKNNQILLNKFSHRFLATTMLFTVREILIWVNLIGWLVGQNCTAESDVFVKICNFK
jgi:hypothetical protein